MTPHPEPNLLSPKIDFLRDSKRADAHQEMVMGPAFRQAAEVAMLEFVHRITTDRNPAQHSLVGIQIAGARAFLRELMNLGLAVPREQPRGDSDNLLPT